MKTTTERQPLAQIQTDALIIPVFEGKPEERFGAAELFNSGELAGKSLELALIHHPDGVAAKRLLFVGAGKPEKFDGAELRKLAGAAVRHLKSKSVKNAALALEAGWSGEEYVSAAIEGAILGNYEPDRYKTGNDKKSFEAFVVVAEGGASGAERAAEQGRIIADAQNFARDLVNEPANRLTPGKVAAAAREMAPKYGLECEVLDGPQMEKLGMGALL